MKLSPPSRSIVCFVLLNFSPSTALSRVATIIDRDGQATKPVVQDGSSMFQTRRREGLDNGEHLEASADGTSLLGTSLLVNSQQAAGQHLEVSPDRRHDASWFAGFSHDESTFDESGVTRGRNDEKGIGGWEPTDTNPYVKQIVSTEFFHESPSYGAKAAWQTHYPAVTTGLAGHGTNLGKWHQGHAGSWFQEYRGSAPPQAGPLSADFFDTSANQVDGFGREQLPSALSAKRYAPQGFSARSVNSTLQCVDPGCTDKVTLNVFNGETERAKHCKLSFMLRATDYDSPEEWIDFIKINDAVVNTQCQIKRTGCNASAWAPLYPCLSDLPLDLLINGSGKLTVEAKISQWVDDCPYKAPGDNKAYLLSAVPMVTCLVGQKQPAPLFAHNDPIFAAAVEREAFHENATDAFNQLKLEGGENMGNMNIQSDGKNILHVGGSRHGGNSARILVLQQANQEIIDPAGKWHFVQAPLKCPDRGCTASLTMTIDKSLAMAGGTCLLTVRVNQTDFGKSYGSDESLKYKLGGENATAVVVAVPNADQPCRREWSGNPMPKDQLEFDALSTQDVTTQVKAGLLTISMTIGQRVDDCPSQAFLLDGLARINCTK